MSPMNFSEEDKTKLIDFLNMVAKYAKFEFNTEELIKYFKLLSHMQQSVVPKVNANILEIKNVIKPAEAPKPEPKKSRSKR